MATERERARCRERLEALSASGLDCESIRREAIADLQRVIGFDRWCWPLADPETLLPLDAVAEHDYGPECLVSSSWSTRATTSRRSTSSPGGRDPAGEPEARDGRRPARRSSRWDEVMRPVGIGDVATVACRDAAGLLGVDRGVPRHGGSPLRRARARPPRRGRSEPGLRAPSQRHGRSTSRAASSRRARPE